MTKNGNPSSAGRWLSLAVFASIAVAYIAVSWWVGRAAGPFEADPDYIYLMNGLEMLTLKSPAYYTHPGTPIEMMIAIGIGLIWLVSLPGHGFVSVVDHVLAHPNDYLGWINVFFIACGVAGLMIFACAVRRASGRLFPAVVGALSVFLFLPAFLALHRVSCEPILLAAGLVLAGILSPLAFAEGAYPETRRLGIAIGCVIGFCLAVKATAAPLLLVIFLLRTAAARKAALVAAIVAAVVLTLPVASHYVEMVSWYLGLFTHQGGYGSGDVGVPSSVALAGDARTLITTMPETFICLALYGVVILARTRLFRRTPDNIARALIFCVLVIGVDLLLVLKQPEARYTVPTVAFLCLGNAIVATALFTRLPAWSAAGFAVLLALLGAWRENDRVQHLISVRQPVAAVMRQATDGNCLLVPYYGVNTTEFDLSFGNGWAGSPFTDKLKRTYPDFVQFDNGHRQFADFKDVFSTQAALARFAHERCVYLVGSPLARFGDFGLAKESLVKVAQSPGGVGEAISIYALQPGWERGATPANP